MKNQNIHLRRLVLAALFVAMDLLFTRVFSIYLLGGAERLSLQFLANAVSAWFLGPVWGAGIAAAADLLGGFMSLSGMSFFPGFTVTCLLRGLLYGLVLYKKPISFPRCLWAVSLASVLGSLLLNAVWLSFYMGKNYWAWIVAKAPFILICIPVFSYILYITQKGLKSLKEKMIL